MLHEWSSLQFYFITLFLRKTPFHCILLFE
uniref:Uncharacterized protein n=1 Tax=Anguilla anguilla TaxID=7936 RepID=A0A0E9UX80_ANGAN